MIFFSFFSFSGPITFTYNDHGYFYSGDVEAHAEDKVDWLEARNICREYCMDLVSIETPSENDLLEELIKGGKTPKTYICAQNSEVCNLWSECSLKC